jgi:type II secretory ATPase GspE/PulE/Tfp pilus assembly ATPase PilB-like protein
MACGSALLPNSDQIMDRLFIRLDTGQSVATLKLNFSCYQTGHYGHLTIRGPLIIDCVQRIMITKEAATLEMQDYALKNCFKTKHCDGTKKVLQILNALEKVERATVVAR